MRKYVAKLQIYLQIICFSLQKFYSTGELFDVIIQTYYLNVVNSVLWQVILTLCKSDNFYQTTTFYHEILWRKHLALNIFHIDAVEISYN